MSRFTSALTTIAVVGLFAGTWTASANPVVAASKANASIHGTISFWNTYNGSGSPPNEESVLLGKVIPAFEKQYPKVKVDNLTLPYNGTYQKLVTDMPAGKGPDVLRSDILWMPALASQGFLYPMDKVSWFGSYKKRVFPGTLRTNFWRGHYYGISLDTNTRVLISNTAVLHQAKISGPPRTISQFLTDCAKIKKLRDGKYCYAEGGSQSWNVGPWIWSFGGSITNKNYTKATGYLNDKESVAAIQMLVNLYKRGEMTPTILGSGIGTTDCLGKGVCGFIIDGPWMHPILAGVYPHLKYKFSLIPAGAGGSRSPTGGEDITISKFSKNKAADEAFVKFMLSKTAQTDMGNIGDMPVLKSLSGSRKLPAYYKIFDKQLGFAKPRTPSPQINNIDLAIQNAVQAALRGESVKTALTSAAKTIDGYLK